jgi:hypothetical protein
VAEVVEEFITETLAFMGAGDEASNIEELDRDGAPARDAGTVVRFAAVGEIETGAGTGNLEVADCALWVDGCETRMRRRSGWGPKYQQKVSQRSGLREISCAQISAASSESR